MYGLLGKTLKHSLSKEIHHLFGNNEYVLFETDSLDSFFQNVRFSGINVTIPFKEAVIPYLDELDPISKRIGAVNTIVRENDRLIGYNTDYDGLKALLEIHQIDIQNKKILVIGNGGAAKMSVVLMNDLHADKCLKICRHPQEEDEIPFKSIDKVWDYDIIVNTTPVGMYPNNQDELAIPLSNFNHLECVIDLIYNPLKTKLLLSAEQLNVKAVNGLSMLVMQAKRSHELFFKTTPIAFEEKQVYQQIKNSMTNIVLIGLPLSGKSKYARLLAKDTGKECIDTDESIEYSTRKTITKIFETEGEIAFRKLEKDFIESIYKSRNLVISTGGGMICDSELVMNLKQNGYLIYLDKDPAIISELTIHNRPLIQSSKDIIKLDKIRRPLYQKYQDLTITISKDTEYHLNEIEEKYHEYLSH